MKKNLIALSVAAMVGGLGLSTAAHADVVPGTATDLRFTGDGIGHAMLIPYYTVQNGNVTIFSVINTDTVNGKAVKVRFRAASNSDDVFDFQVFMSPGDVFTGAVTRGANGTAEFSTADNSCTLPANVNTSFVLSRLSGPEQVGGAGTREGYVEIFNMADIPPLETDLGDGAIVTAADTNGDNDTLDANALYTAIKHVNGVAPCALNTGRLATLLATNVSTAASLVGGVHVAGVIDTTNPTSAHVKGLNRPTGTLFGGWTIINVDEAMSFSAATSVVVAVNGAGGPSAPANIVFWPQRDFTIGGDVNVFTSDPLLKLGGTNAGIAFGGVSPRAFDLPDMSTPYTTLSINTPWRQAAELTRALAVNSINNEFASDAVISAASDWVFSMPSRRYNVAVRYSNGTTGSGAPIAVYTDLADGEYGDGVIPGTFDAFDVFTDTFGDATNYFTPTNTSVINGQVCILGVSTTAADRSESFLESSTDFVISPSTPGDPVSFCGETSVLSFNAGGVASASVLGATIARQDIDVTFENGWASLATPGLTSKGLPVLGAYFLKAVNPSTPAGVSANYGVSWDHRVTRPVAP